MSIKLNGSTDGSVSLEPPADTSPTGTDITLTLPTSAGSANQFLKNSGTAGTLEYSSLIEDSSGRVLVGTTTEGQTDADDFTVSNSGNCGVTIRSGTSSVGSIYFSDGTSGTDEYRGFIDYSHNGDYLRLGTGGAERMRIHNGGGVSVGSHHTLITSDTPFQISTTSGRNWAYINSESLSNNDFVGLYARGEVSGTSRLAFIGVRKHSGITNGCGYIFLDQQDGNNSYFWADDSGVFRTSSNNDHAGTTSGTVVGTQTSDERLKNVGAAVSYGLAEIKQLQPKQYALKTEPETNKLGFIAQEVESIIPEAVFDTNEELEGHEDGDRTKLGMEYVQLIPVLVNAIKELSAENADLAARITTLEASS